MQKQEASAPDTGTEKKRAKMHRLRNLCLRAPRRHRNPLRPHRCRSLPSCSHTRRSLLVTYSKQVIQRQQLSGSAGGRTRQRLPMPLFRHIG